MRTTLIAAVVMVSLVCGPRAGAQDDGGDKTMPAKPTGAASTGQSPAAPAYILGPSDVVEVGVLGRADFTTRGRINEDGTIRLPFIGAVQAANKTSEQLSADVAGALESGGFFSHPIVKVDVVSYASRYVTVLGSFAAPGLVPVDRAYRLSEIVARVGGVREGAADYVVFRPRQGEERHISVSALATGDGADDPFVAPGDKIYAPQADMMFISGQIKLPGSYPISPGMTLRMALSRGGGLTDSGSDKKITITRKGKKLDHIDLEQKVEAGDVIVIGERLF